MPFLATWKKDSSGSFISMRRTAESRRFGRDVSPFHLVNWVHLCLVGLFGLVVVGVVAVSFCWSRLHLGFLHGICQGPNGASSFSRPQRRLDDRQSLGTRMAAAQKKNHESRGYISRFTFHLIFFWIDWRLLVWFVCVLLVVWSGFFCSVVFFRSIQLLEHLVYYDFVGI